MKPHEEFIIRVMAEEVNRMDCSRFCGFLASMVAGDGKENELTKAIVRKLDVIGLKLEAMELIEGESDDRES